MVYQMTCVVFQSLNQFASIRKNTYLVDNIKNTTFSRNEKLYIKMEIFAFFFYNVV